MLMIAHLLALMSAAGAMAPCSQVLMADYEGSRMLMSAQECPWELSNAQECLSCHAHAAHKHSWTLMKTHDEAMSNLKYGSMEPTALSQSGQVFPQFWVFEAIFEARGKNPGFLKTPFVHFIVLKTTVSIPWFQCKNRFEKRTTLGRDIWEKNKMGLRFGLACHV